MERQPIQELKVLLLQKPSWCAPYLLPDLTILPLLAAILGGGSGNIIYTSKECKPCHPNYRPWPHVPVDTAASLVLAQFEQKVSSEAGSAHAW